MLSVGRVCLGAVGQVVDQLKAESTNDMTLLMYAARSGDKMTFKAVTKWCRLFMAPSEVRYIGSKIHWSRVWSSTRPC